MTQGTPDITQLLEEGTVTVTRLGEQLGVKELKGMGIADLVSCEIRMGDATVFVNWADTGDYGTNARFLYIGRKTMQVDGRYNAADALPFLLSIYDPYHILAEAKTD